MIELVRPYRVHTVVERSWKVAKFKICIPSLESHEIMELQIFAKIVFSCMKDEK